MSTLAIIPIHVAGAYPPARIMLIELPQHHGLHEGEKQPERDRG